MKRNAIYFLGLFLAPAGAFFVPPTSSSKRTRWSASIGDFFPTLDTSALSLTSPGIKEAVLLLTPLSAFAGSAVVNQRRKEVVENLEFTQMAMNETQTIMTQSSNNFKVYTGLAIASFAVVAASQLLSSSNAGGLENVLFAVPVIAFGGGAFFKTRSDEVFENLDATRRAMNETQAMMIESQNRDRIFTGISAISLGIAILSQLGSLEFVSFSADNPATYQFKDTPSTVTSYKSLDSLKPPEINVPSSASSSPEKDSSTESKPPTTSDIKSDE